ncbi:MAG: hypothetical protein NZ551_07860 [Microscillaceae bacterium]|nr:hypothetical protein [Microscillaceae bacterium]MDW8461111.1 hypothetical protein [Cytophagales bacterium]
MTRGKTLLSYFVFSLFSYFHGGSIWAQINYLTPAPASTITEEEHESSSLILKIDTLPWNNDFYIRLTHQHSPELLKNKVNIQVFDQRTHQPSPYFEKQKLAGRIYHHQYHYLAGKKALFLYHHSGLTNEIQHKLIYLIAEGEIVHSGSLEMINEEKLIDLDNDGIAEILHTDHHFYTLPLPNCQVGNSELQALTEYSEYKGSLAPQIYKLIGYHFKPAKGKTYLQCLRKYLNYLEQQLLKMRTLDNHSLDILDFAHYFYVCQQLGEENRAWKFLKENNQPFAYTCFEHGYEHLIKTTVLDFIEQHQQLFTRP